MSLIDVLPDFKIGIEEALNQAVEDGSTQTGFETVIENLSNELSREIDTYARAATVETNDLVLPGAIITQSAGPSISPTVGTGTGTISNLDIDTLRVDIYKAYEKIVAHGQLATADSRVINENLGEDLSRTIYRYALTAEVNTENELDGFPTVGLPPGITPAQMPSGETGIGIGIGGTVILDLDSGRTDTISSSGGLSISSISDLEISRSRFEKAIKDINSTANRENIVLSKIIVERSSDNSMRLVTALDSNGMMINNQITQELINTYHSLKSPNETHSDDIGLTSLGASIPDLSSEIEIAYNRAAEQGGRIQADYKVINKELGETIGQAIHAFFVSSIVITGILYEGGLVESPLTSQMPGPGGTIPTQPTPVTLPGGIGIGTGRLL